MPSSRGSSQLKEQSLVSAPPVLQADSLLLSRREAPAGPEVTEYGQSTVNLRGRSHIRIQRSLRQEDTEVLKMGAVNKMISECVKQNCKEKLEKSP